MEQINIFSMMNDEDKEKFAPKKSNDWKWTFADYPEKNGLKVFSCFACGGGSTMGYKLAGCEVLGCVELDEKMNEIYKKNHNPKYNFCMDIRDFNKIPNKEIPIELFNLDILDGSPPCTTFSMAGQREETWGKEKKFREGQKLQTLDDLSFVFIDTVAKLNPKTVIMENVEGLLLGEAFKYVQDIYTKFKEIGYKVHHWLLKGEYMGVPQTRHRVFFVAIREDLGFDPHEINMSFNYEPVVYEEIKDGECQKINKDTKTYQIIKQAEATDKTMADTRERMGEKPTGFNDVYAWKGYVLPTLRATNGIYDADDVGKISKETIVNAQTFPQDYDFESASVNTVSYICGMSVPPVMIKRIVMRLIESGVYDYKLWRCSKQKMLYV